MSQALEHYGWKEAAPHSCDYIVEPLLSMIRPFRAQRVLDVGCGNGALATRLVEQGYSVTGVDASADGIEVAAQRVPDATFVQGDITSSTFDWARLGSLPFDLVVSTEVIEHVWSVGDFTSALARAVGDDGRVVLSTPYHGYLKNLALSLTDHWDAHHGVDWTGGHIKFFSRRSLASSMEKAGLREVSWQGVGRMPYLWKSMLACFEPMDRSA